MYDSMSAPFGAIGSEHRGAKATLEDPLMRIKILKACLSITRAEARELAQLALA